MFRRMMIEAKNAATLIAVLIVVFLWYTFYYNTFAKASTIGGVKSIPYHQPEPYGSFQIAMIEDGDSQVRPTEKTWGSMYLRGKLEYSEEDGKRSMRFEVLNTTILTYNLAEGGRGMELSELVKFNKELLAVDDRTGVVYAIENNMVIPRHILVDGNGHSKKGFKGEWMTVKDHYMYVGGFGKPWTTITGEIVNYDPMWVKKISPEGAVEHRFWRRRYEKLMKAAGVWYPGYIYYEAVCWSEVHEKWFFLPRRLSKEAYNEKADEQMGTNVMLIADELFNKVEVVHVMAKVPSYGFSSFKFLPYSGDNIIVALITEEVDGQVQSFITAFTISGEPVLPIQLISRNKFEGIEFL